SEAAREMPGNANVYNDLAEIYIAAGQPDKALDEYRRALAIEPGNEKAPIGIASIYLGRNEEKKALEELKKAELANPQNKELHLLKADIYEKSGESKLAEYELLMGGKPKSEKSAAAPVPQKPVEEPVAQADIDK